MSVSLFKKENLTLDSPMPTTHPGTEDKMNERRKLSQGRGDEHRLWLHIADWDVSEAPRLS
jgi:hypothetical protein